MPQLFLRVILESIPETWTLVVERIGSTDPAATHRCRDKSGILERYGDGGGGCRRREVAAKSRRDQGDLRGLLRDSELAPVLGAFLPQSLAPESHKRDVL